MTQLMGSPKQIAWAEDIRAKALAQEAAARAAAATYPEHVDALLAQIDSAIAEMHAQASAKAWIDARFVAHPTFLVDWVAGRYQRAIYGTVTPKIFGR